MDKSPKLEVELDCSGIVFGDAGRSATTGDALYGIPAAEVYDCDKCSNQPSRN